MKKFLSDEERQLIALCRGARHNDDWNGHYLTDLVAIIDRLVGQIVVLDEAREALEYVMSAHGEQLHEAFEVANRALAQARGQ